MSWTLAAFIGIAVGTLFAAFEVVTEENVAHAALYLAMTFVGISGMYLLLQSGFLAAVQIIIYAGAIMTVLIFAIMLSDVHMIQGTEHSNVFQRITSRHWGLAPLLIAGGFAILVILAIFQGGDPLQVSSQLTEAPDVASLGTALLSTYVVPFEVASVLLLAALIGAIVITAERREEKR